jgi:hypothetical protein
MTIKISIVGLLLTLTACPGVTSQVMQSARMHKRVYNAAQRDQGALVEERHLQVEENMSVSATSCMPLEVNTFRFDDMVITINEAPIETPPEPTVIAVEEVPIETPTEPTKIALEQVPIETATKPSSTASTKAAKTFRAKEAKRF